MNRRKTKAMPNKKESKKENKKGYTGVFVIDYLIKEGVVKEEESMKLAYMISSHDYNMRQIAHAIVVEKWKTVYPTDVCMKSRLLKKVTDE